MKRIHIRDRGPAATPETEDAGQLSPALQALADEWGKQRWISQYKAWPAVAEKADT